MNKINLISDENILKYIAIKNKDSFYRTRIDSQCGEIINNYKCNKKAIYIDIKSGKKICWFCRLNKRSD